MPGSVLGAALERFRSDRSSVERVDLSEDSEFFLDLLASNNWHERLVSELRFGSRNHVRVISSYQIDFPPALLERYEDEGLKNALRANILLPLTTRPKRQLLNFSLSGPEGSSATLTSRVSIAALQAQYLMLLAETSYADGLASIDSQLYESICVFTPEFFQETFLKACGSDNVDEALARYLSGGLGWNVLISDVRRWRERTVEAGHVLAKHLGEPYNQVSSSEEVLLAIPHNSTRPRSPEEIDSLVFGFCDGIEAADHASDNEFLVALAEYGRRYELVVEVEVPLLEPSRIKVEEDVPLELKLRRLRPWVGQAFPLGDSRSAHIEARVDDANVEVAEFELHDPEGKDAKAWLESIRHTREALAIYGNDPERPRFATLWLRLSVTRPLMIGAVMLSLANVIAIVAIPLIDFDGSVGDRLAVLVIPTTIAATFALVREQTALAARLQWIPRLILTLTTVALWLEVVVGLIVLDEGHPHKDSERRPGHGSKLAAGWVSPLR